VEPNSGVDLVLVRIRDYGTDAAQAANAGFVESVPEGDAAGPAETSPSAAFVWGAEHALFAVTLAAIGCVEALALLGHAG
jgi:hypothetical protein